MYRAVWRCLLDAQIEMALSLIMYPNPKPRDQDSSYEGGKYHLR